MTFFETLTLLISLLAIVLSLHTLREQRKLQREANELQRATDELARRQIREMDQAAVERQRAALEVELRRDRTSSTLCIGNVSTAEARDVNVHFDPLPGISDPVSSTDRELRLPVKRLAPGSWALLPCTIFLEHPPALEGIVSWINPDDSSSQERFKVFT
jgi:hypothetical protein